MHNNQGINKISYFNQLNYNIIEIDINRDFSTFLLFRFPIYERRKVSGALGTRESRFIAKRRKNRTEEPRGLCTRHDDPPSPSPARTNEREGVQRESRGCNNSETVTVNTLGAH